MTISRMLGYGKCRRFFSCFVLIFLVCIQPVCVCAQASVSPSEAVLVYDQTQQAILAQIARLGQLKADVLSRKAIWQGGNEEQILSSEDELRREIEHVRVGLLEAGARPSVDMLAALRLDQPAVMQGKTISNFADLAKTLGDTYELWGIPQTVETAAGRCDTYDLVIQGAAGSQALSAALGQADDAGNDGENYELYRAGASFASQLEGQLGDIRFEKIAETRIDGCRVSDLVYDGAQMLQSMLAVDDLVPAEQMVSVGKKSAIGGAEDVRAVTGLPISYRIRCSAVVTVHFLFVCDAATGQWQHTFTTNTVSLSELHLFLLTYTRLGRMKSCAGSQDYSITLFPTQWAYRLDNAVAAYQNDLAKSHDVIDAYRLNVTNGGTPRKVFSLAIPCPLTPKDLVKTQDHALRNGVLLAAAVVGVAAAVAAVWLIHRRRVAQGRLSVCGIV